MADALCLNCQPHCAYCAFSKHQTGEGNETTKARIKVWRRESARSHTRRYHSLPTFRLYHETRQWNDFKTPTEKRRQTTDGRCVIYLLGRARERNSQGAAATRPPDSSSLGIEPPPYRVLLQRLPAPAMPTTTFSRPQRSKLGE